MKFMIVDDHPGVRDLVRQLVASPEDQVRECASGDEAVRIADEFKPDCVTMDVRMPGIDGIAATRAIRRRHPAARIVIVSTFDQAEFRQAARDAGAIAYVRKENLADLRTLFAQASDQNASA